MTGLVIRILTCDGIDDGEVCDGEHGGDPSVLSLYDLRIAAGRIGWRHDPAKDTDYCPKHSERRTP